MTARRMRFSGHIENLVTIGTLSAGSSFCLTSAGTLPACARIHPLCQLVGGGGLVLEVSSAVYFPTTMHRTASTLPERGDTGGVGYYAASSCFMAVLLPLVFPCPVERLDVVGRQSFNHVKKLAWRGS